MFFEPRPRRRSRPQLKVSERRLVLRLGDVVATVLAVLLSLLIWTIVDKRRPYNLAFILEQGYWLILLPGLWLLLASANDFYDLQLAAARLATAVRLVVITLQMMIVYLIIFFLSPREELPRLFILYYSVTSFMLIMLWRMIRPRLMSWASERRRALIVGANWGGELIVQAIREHAPGQYELVGAIGGPDDEVLGVDGLKVLGTGREMLEIAQQHGVTEVIVATPCELTGELFQGVMDCHQQGISIVPMTLLYERLTGRVPVEYVGKDWAIILPIESASIFDPYPLLKRLFDLILATCGMIAFTVLLPFVAIAMQLDSPGPIFFSQTRVGKGGKPFRIVKLRSMIPDAEKHTGAVFASKDDRRITRVGRLLRKSRLDEVPQLWNVLRGEMSMIGPRPERPEFIAELSAEIPFYRARLAVKPGVTGWAQVRYGYGSETADHLIKLQYDLYYVRHHSLLLDLQIAIRTVGKMLSFAGR